jgi:hypothetical protein
MGVAVFEPLKRMWNKLLRWIARGRQRAPACGH